MRWEIGRNSRGWVKFCLAYLLITNVCVMNLFSCISFNFTTKKFFFFFVKSFFSRQFAFHVSFSQFGHSGSIFRGENLKSRSYFRRYKDGRLPPIFEKYPEPGFRLPHEYDNVSNLQNRYIWNCEPATAFFFKKSSSSIFFFLAKVNFLLPKDLFVTQKWAMEC